VCGRARPAAPEGYVRPFLDEGPAVRTLLPRVQPVAPLFVDQVLGEGAGEPAPSRPAAPAPVLAEPLSERELEVLALAAAGLSNREIAGRLIVTVGTVKTHIHNILGKLEVRNRTQAVTRARELGLV
jgi:LuxR family maltose regulon positive regulatory protein